MSEPNGIFIDVHLRDIVTGTTTVYHDPIEYGSSSSDERRRWHYWAVMYQRRNPTDRVEKIVERSTGSVLYSEET